MVSVKEENLPHVQYKLVAPDGGWGHLITVSLSIMNLVTLIPGVCFGLLYGEFLASVGDETAATAVSNGAFITAQSFTGLLANYLLQNYSYRTVGIMGAVIYNVGTFTTVFVTNVPIVIITYGIVQGVGYGLLLPATLSAFNCYFNKRLNFMMGISQTIVAVGTMIFPPIVALLVNSFGFRGALAIIAAMSLLNFPCMGVLQPVERHMRKVALETLENSVSPPVDNEDEIKINCEGAIKTQVEPLLNQSIGGDVKENIDFNENHEGERIKMSELVSKPRMSVVSLGAKTTSLVKIMNNVAEEEHGQTLCINLSLLKDAKYLNISCGLSFAYTSDIMFFSIVPLLLHNVGYATKDVAFMMMVYFGLDLLSRVLLSVVSAVCEIRNRHVFLAGAILTAVFRTAFIMNNTYIWKMTTIGILGLLRGLIQTPMALVISEEYSKNFSTAFSLFMVVCGLINLVFGPLISFVKSYTKDDIMVVHLLSAAYLLCGIPWTIELLWTKFRHNQDA